MARFLPLRDVYSASEDEDEDQDTLLTDDVDGPGEAFHKYYNRFIEKFRSRKRAKAKRKKAEEKKEKENEKEDESYSRPTVDENEYDFNNAKRGMAIVINNDKFHSESNMGDRKGSKRDADGLETMFKQLGFDVTLFNNLTTKEMVSLLKQAASNKRYDHEEADCFACAILTHGGEEIFQAREGSSNSKVRHDVVFGVDGTMVPTRFLLSIFNDECCPELEGKPKLFFIQACRGGEMDKGMEIKVLTRRKRTTENTSSGGHDQQDAQRYMSEESEEEDEPRDDISSVPESEIQAPREHSSVPETQHSEDVSQQSHQEEPTSGGEVSDPQDLINDAVKDDSFVVQETKKEHPVKESSVQESQGPAVEVMNEEKGPQEQDQGTLSEESNVVYSRIPMEKILTISPPPLYKDFLLMYAAPPGYFAWRRDSGGWLIQMLVKVLRTADVNNVPLTRLLTTVSSQVSKYESSSRKERLNRKKLIPCVMSMLTKDVYFRAKHS